jgi:hypothetical protein
VEEHWVLRGSVWVYFFVFHHSILCKGHIFAWRKICDPEFCQVAAGDMLLTPGVTFWTPHLLIIVSMDDEEEEEQ